MNLTSRTVLNTFAIVGFCVAANAAEAPPRLWEVTGKNEQGVTGKFYILPVTHNGLAAEHDDYFYRTVVPIAMQADLFLHESSGMLPADAPACPIPFADTTENREILGKAHADVARALLNIIPPAAAMPGDTENDRLQAREASRIFAHSLTRDLSEYGLIIAMGSYLTKTQESHPERLPKADAGYASRPEIARYIAYRRQKDGKKANASIDEKYDLVNAYCGLGKDRPRYLQRWLALLDPTKFAPPSKNELVRMDEGFVDAVRDKQLNGVLVDALAGYGDAPIVCDRNDKWLAKMKQNLGGGIRFYALGMAHVFQPAPNDKKRCDGLLLRLEKTGFTISVVK
ncbi:hypothetical protein Q4S45_03745 [Massilia sp. R2A-15]|uniref:hypothetical protein n=1 Tax=Massilia sp. R2A-15 TaxID=3064278 RepID=UPI0027361BEE|nr:hypothetical protein [Massilia sp. R2A-15]WLI90248.1 hypothetical protein Q4S45_03745 [Massilia sp. R2A-15]